MNDWLLGMTTTEEQNYVRKYARSVYSGEGEIVDLGCWLGSTTISLALGLAENNVSILTRKRIHAYDLFQWEDYMESCLGDSSLRGKFKRGDNFLPELMHRIEPHLEYVHIHAGDLHAATWNDQPIELLLIDAMKSWSLANDIMRIFFPSLIVGKSQVFQQDFAHYYTSWLHLIHYMFQDYFRLIFAIPNSYGLVFQYTKRIPEDLLNVPYDFQYFSDVQVEEAFKHSMGLVSDEYTKANIASAHVMWHLHVNDPERARFLLNRYLSQSLPLAGDLKIVSDVLQGYFVS